jgi:hypothetical protein
VFGSRRACVQHMSAVGHHAPYKCSRCPLRLKTMADTKQHETEEHFWCSDCSREFQGYNSIRMVRTAIDTCAETTFLSFSCTMYSRSPPSISVYETTTLHYTRDECMNKLTLRHHYIAPELAHSSRHIDHVSSLRDGVRDSGRCRAPPRNRFVPERSDHQPRRDVQSHTAPGPFRRAHQQTDRLGRVDPLRGHRRHVGRILLQLLLLQAPVQYSPFSQPTPEVSHS